MNYENIYNNLMMRAQNRKLEGYSEKHHIKPRCLGGGDESENIAVLTSEEHYVAHLLLVKMYPNHKGLIWAAMAMTNGTEQMSRKNKRYGWLRKRFAEQIVAANKGQKRSAESKAKMSAAKLGKKRNPHSEETKLKMSLAAKGKLKSPEAVEKMRLSKKGKFTYTPTEEIKEKIRLASIEAAKRRTHKEKQTPEYKAHQAAKMKEIWAKRKSGALPLPNRTFT